MKRDVEAVLFVGRGPVHEEINQLRAHGVPWRCASDSAVDESGSDVGYVTGAFLAMDYLWSLGHGRLVLLIPRGLDGSRLSVTELQAKGASVEFAEAPAASDPAAVGTMLATLLDGSRRASAVICSADTIALAAVRSCAARGIAVPGDLSIVGFGDEPFARYCSPALTTIRVATAALAERSVDRLLSGGPDEFAASRVAIAKLILRESTAPFAHS